MVSFYSWSSSSSDHLPTVFVCARLLLFIFFMILNISHLLQSRSIFHETKSISRFFLFSKEKRRSCQFDPYLYSHYLDCRFFHSDIWYFDNFKLIICLHCNHSLILQIDYFSVPGKVIIVLLFNHNHRLISFETLHCCCHHHQPGLRILTFSCNFLKSASGIDVRDQFVHPFPYIKSISRKGFIGRVWSERLPFLRKATFQTAQVAWLFSTADWTDTQHLTYALSPSSTLLNNGQLLAYPLPPLVSTGQHLPHPHHPLSAFDLPPRQQWSAIATPHSTPPATDEICERRLKNTHLERSWVLPTLSSKVPPTLSSIFSEKKAM